VTDQIPITDTKLSVTSLSDRQVRDASLILAGHACDAGELAEWLEACGLRPYLSADRLWTGRPKQVRPSRLEAGR
jgi:hypothetical protein